MCIRDRSTATVSYVLNDLPGHSIPEGTRVRVRDAARDLGYTRSSAARTLARGRSDIVLLLVPELPLGHVPVSYTHLDVYKRQVSDHLETARADILAFTALPKALWRQA